MCEYYSLEENPGVTKQNESVRNYDFLDDPELKEKLIDFTDGTTTQVLFHIPSMHCSSCIWILENLYKLNTGVINSRANFLKKQVSIRFYEEKTSLKEIVALLESIGYEPNLSLEEKEKDAINRENKKLYYKIGVAGFAFGNIMLMSFPEYLSIQDSVTDNLRHTFAWLNMLLALPVFFYSSSEYFSSAIKGLRKKIVNIDVPVSLGILVLFLRSSVEVVFDFGPGYFDSLAGLVFFLLVGRLFQNKTYETLNFERNYKSYFPIAVTKKSGNEEKPVPVEKIEVGNRLVIHNNEIIPADSILIHGHANIDYSFVTGESNPVPKNNGDTIFAGGRQVGSAIEVDVIKDVSQSYLTRLWNNDIFDEDKESKFTTLANSVSKHFTFVIIAIAIISSAIWLFYDTVIALHVFTAVLIVACPCALALSTPFTMGNTLRFFGLKKFYLKNIHFIEKLAVVDTIVFDKTGTITDNTRSLVTFNGNSLTKEEKRIIASITRNSIHPLSKKIYAELGIDSPPEPEEYQEISGEGITAKIEGKSVKLGSAGLIFDVDEKTSEEKIGAKVFVSIDEKYLGYFLISNFYREGLKEIISELSKAKSLAVLSGDNESERTNLAEIFPEGTEMRFKQSPEAKLNFIKEKQGEGKAVLMLGDGLNDAGALRQSDVGVSIAENINNFTPSSDAILEASSFNLLEKFLSFSVTAKKIILASFGISFVYNIVGLGVAVSGLLSPVIAAILMPLSSITVVIFTTMATGFYAKKRKLL
ncbi:MAG: ATPase [Melioribacteraceae bacterium]|nr:MAG: ATPase [Melioribacteraceae bacterium]